MALVPAVALGERERSRRRGRRPPPWIERLLEEGRGRRRRRRRRGQRRREAPEEEVEPAEPVLLEPEAGWLAQEIGYALPAAVRSEGWGPAVAVGDRIAVRARRGYRAAVQEVRPGLFLVGEVPEAAARPEFGILPLLAPAMVAAASRMIPPGGVQIPAPTRASYPPHAAPQAYSHPVPAPYPPPHAVAPVPQVHPGYVLAPAPAVAGFGCDRCGCGRCGG